MPPTVPLSQSDVYEIWRAYLPQEHWRMIKNSPEGIMIRDDVAMQMYGSRDLLMDAVNTFGLIPGSHNVFGEKLTEPLSLKPSLFRSLKNKEYIYKQGAYCAFFAHVFFLDPSAELIPIVSFFLKTKEKDLKGVHELIPFEPVRFQEFSNKLNNELPFENKIKLRKKTPAGILEEFQKILPPNDKDPKFSLIEKVIEEQIKEHAIKKDIHFYETWLTKINAIVRHVNKFIEDCPDWFKPKSDIQKGPAIVRLFNEEKEKKTKFMLAHELLSEMKRAQLDVSAIEEEISGMHELDTLNAKYVFDKIKHQFGQIEFVVTPVLRSKFRAHYIPNMSGGFLHCTAELVMEIMHDLICVKKLFQNLTPQELDKICELLNAVADSISIDHKNRRFVTQDQAVHLRHLFIKQLKQDLPDVLAKKKLEVHRISMKGFTVKDFEDEMHRMGLVKTFPKVTSVVEQMYGEMAREFKGKPYHEYVMFHGLGAAQFFHIISKATKLFKALHNMEACSCIGLSCPFCENAESGTEVDLSAAFEIGTTVELLFGKLQLDSEKK